MTAAEIRAQLADLEAEHRLASVSGLTEVDSYVDDLNWELVACRELYIGTAVTEIATLRAELSGPLLG
jgi:hypothetical protein